LLADLTADCARRRKEPSLLIVLRRIRFNKKEICDSFGIIRHGSQMFCTENSAKWNDLKNPNEIT